MHFSNKFRIKVKTNSSKTEILEHDSGEAVYKMNVSAHARGNKANIEIIKFFTKLSGKKVRIISGKTSKLKTLLLE